MRSCRLLIGSKSRYLPRARVLREPGVEARRGETVGALLLVGGADRQEVGVFVLHVLVVAPDPAPIDDGMRGRHLREFCHGRVPERPVLRRQPRASQSLRTRSCLFTRYSESEMNRTCALRTDGGSTRAPDGRRSPILLFVRCGAHSKKSQRATPVPRRSFDQRRIAARLGLGRVVAEAALIGVHQDERARHGWIATGMSVCCRISRRATRSRRSCVPMPRAPGEQRIAFRLPMTRAPPRRACRVDVRDERHAFQRPATLRPRRPPSCRFAGSIVA